MVVKTGRRKKYKRKKYVRRNRALLSIAVLVILLILAAIFINKCTNGRKEKTLDAVEEEGTGIVPEYPRVVSSATIGSTGDILIHMPVLNAFYTGYGYDFSPAFSYIE
ncbi:MAG: hypothetical protein HUJ76_11100, partial [Parasporobacterium sp.]|nr:hypothetical protein [Parasporobacterium sp.]